MLPSLVLLLFSCFARIVTAGQLACLPGNPSSAVPGLKGVWYKYKVNDKTALKDPTYMGYRYRDGESFHTQYGINSLSFDVGIPCYDSSGNLATMCYQGKHTSGSDGASWACNGYNCYNDRGSPAYQDGLFDYKTTTTNVTIEFTGYFLAPETGTYTISMPLVDDSAALFFGDPAAFDCCSQNTDKVQSTNFTLSVIKQWNQNPGSATANLELTGGYYYPMRFIYTNVFTYAQLEFFITTPSGEKQTDFTDMLYSFEDDASEPCPAIVTTTEPWTGTDTTTTTDNAFSGSTQTIHVLTPTTATTTTTEPWTGTAVSTSTETGSGLTEIVHILTPTPSLVSTTTTGWTGTFTTTYSTETSVVTVSYTHLDVYKRQIIQRYLDDKDFDSRF